MSTDLALPGSVTETALDLPANLAYEDWQQAGELLGRIGRACQWWIGDWLNFGERRYGEKYAQAIEATGYDYNTLNGYRWVSGQIENVRRRTSLSFGHHEAVAALGPAAQDDLLVEAETSNWSVHELRRQVRRPKGLSTPKAPDGTFDVIYADPPWQYDFSRSDSRAVENQYPTLTVEELEALEIPAADDAVLFIWTTSPKLREGLAVLAAWGFDYKTQMVWVKDKIGMGYYARQQHELVLIAGRGEAPIPATDVRPSSVVEAPRAKHSAKPEKFYDLIEAMYPNNARLELFARAARPGWTSWGNEVEVAA